MSAGQVDELFTRAQGNPFFTEQLVASALAGGGAGELQIPIALPGRLAGLLAARASRCGENAHAVLAALAVASRPLTEELLSDVTALELRGIASGGSGNWRLPACWLMTLRVVRTGLGMLFWLRRRQPDCYSESGRSARASCDSARRGRGQGDVGRGSRALAGCRPQR